MTTVCSIRMGDKVFYTLGEYEEVIENVIHGKPVAIFEYNVDGERFDDTITFFRDVEWVRTESAFKVPAGV